MIGMASGTKAISLFVPGASEIAGGGFSIDAGEEKSVKPILVRMIPPAILTMLSDTPNRRSIKVPKTKKKNISSRA